VAPKLAFAQSGYRSRHGHPALAVQNRLRAMGVPLLTSANCGAFEWWSRTEPGAAGCWRSQQPRYWHQVDPQLGLAGEPGQAFVGPPDEGP
jgi:competence protein ComEC